MNIKQLWNWQNLSQDDLYKFSTIINHSQYLSLTFTSYTSFRIVTNDPYKRPIISYGVHIMYLTAILKKGEQSKVETCWIESWRYERGTLIPSPLSRRGGRDSAKSNRLSRYKVPTYLLQYFTALWIVTWKFRRFRMKFYNPCEPIIKSYFSLCFRWIWEQCCQNLIENVVLRWKCTYSRLSNCR